MLSFADAVRFHRARRLGMSQLELAKTFEVSLRTWQNWESGERQPNPITQRVVIACLESMRSEVIPVASKRVYKSRKQEEVIVLGVAI